MESDGATLLKLSGAARTRVNWDRINDATGGARARSTPGAEPRVADPDRVRRIFAVAKEEFKVGLDSLRRLMTLTMWLVGGAGAVALVGLLLILLLDLKIPGAITSGLSLSALLVLVYKMWQLGRDQAMLELIPTSYEVALSLADSPAQFSKILDQFLSETESLRRAA